MPLEAVHAAVHHGLHNAEVLPQERAEVLIDIRVWGVDTLPYVPSTGALGA